MRRVAAAGLAFAAAAGCAALIDLGDEPTLRPAVQVEPDAGVDGGAPDAATDGNAPPPELCGLERSLSDPCAACIERSCCEESRACGSDVECPIAFECIKDCMGDATCIAVCFGLSGLGANLALCSASKCDICSPKTNCAALGRCGRTLPDAGPEGLFRNVIKNDVLFLDETNCAARLAGFRDAGRCPGQ